MLACVLMLTCLATGGPDLRDDISVLCARLESPLAGEREAAVKALVARGSEVRERMVAYLTEKRVLRRRGAAGYFALAPTDGVTLPLLAERLRDEPDRAVAVELARAVARYGVPGFPTVAAATEARPDRHRLYARAYVAAQLDAVIHKNTGADGVFKGFYDGQFDGLKPLGDMSAPPLEALAMSQNARSIVRRAAVRALGESARPEAIGPLQRVRKRHVELRRYVDTWEVHPRLIGAKQLEAYYDDRFIEYIEYALAKCGDRKGISQRIRHHDKLINDLKRRMRFVPRDRHGAFRAEIAYQMFRMAYSFQQLRNFDTATKIYLELAKDYAESGSASTAWYNLACMESRRRNVDVSLRHLEAALKAGYLDDHWIRTDNDLLNLRADPRFERVMKKYGF